MYIDLIFVVVLRVVWYNLFFILVVFYGKLSLFYLINYNLIIFFCLRWKRSLVI